MSDDRATKKLRALVERPERCEFWGDKYVITPRLIARRFGDGGRLQCIQPLATRPNYFVVRVPSDGYDEVSMLDEIIAAAEEEYGYHGDEDYRGEDDDESRGFPVVDWGVGCTWGRPFPIEAWKPSPRLSFPVRNAPRVSRRRQT